MAISAQEARTLLGRPSETTISPEEAHQLLTSTSTAQEIGRAHV